MHYYLLEFTDFNVVYASLSGNITLKELQSIYPDDSLNSFQYLGTCYGCANDLANQLAHMEPGGCLYED